MKQSADKARMAETWLAAWQLRCCPPDTVLTAKMTDQLRQHLNVCPFCRRERKNSLPPIVLDLKQEPRLAEQQPQPGELWSLRPALGGWGPKYRYYNPPVVLITGADSPGTVQVVQTAGLAELAGADDLPLDNGLTGFAQPWNQYSLQTDTIQACLGHISPLLLSTFSGPSTTPDAEPAPGSILWFFRQMEVETGWYFARQTLVRAFQGIETLFPAVSSSDTAELLLADLARLPLILTNTDPLLLPEDILAHTMPADELLPLAAAEQNRQQIQLLLFLAEQGRILEIQVLPVDVTLIDRQETTLNISGVCPGNLPEDAHWIFRWQSESWSIKPLPGQFGVNDGFFWAAFPVADITNPEEGELVIRLLVQR